MRRIFGVRVAGCKVGSAAEPGGVPFLQIAKVCVNGGNHRIARVEHQRHTGRKKPRAGAQRNFGREFFGKVSVYGREIHPRFFEDLSFFEDTGASAATSFPCP